MMGGSKGKGVIPNSGRGLGILGNEAPGGQTLFLVFGRSVEQAEVI